MFGCITCECGYKINSNTSGHVRICLRLIGGFHMLIMCENMLSYVCNYLGAIIPQIIANTSKHVQMCYSQFIATHLNMFAWVAIILHSNTSKNIWMCCQLIGSYGPQINHPHTGTYSCTQVVNWKAITPVNLKHIQTCLNVLLFISQPHIQACLYVYT